MGRPVTYFEVMGKDGEKLRDFYAELFGWTIDAKTHSRMGSSSVRPTSKASGSGAASAPSPPGMSGHVTFYVEVPDIEAELVQAEKLGGTRIMGPSEVQPGVQLGQFNDPEGHMVGLLKGPA